MPPASTRSAILAGLGSTGSLVAAAALAATAVTGTIAFTSWPGPPTGPEDAEVRLAVPDVPAAVTAALASTNPAASPAARGSATAATAASPGGTPPRPGAAEGRGEAGPAPSSPTGTTPRQAAGGGQSGGRGDEAEPREGEPTLSDATELAGKSISSGLATGTGGIAGEIEDDLPITAGTVAKAGKVTGETVGAVAEVVADALRALPIDGDGALLDGGG